MDFHHLRQSRTIGPLTFHVEPLGFLDGRRGLVRLSKLLGPALTALGSHEGKVTEQALAGALGALVSNLTDEDLAYFQGLFEKRSEVEFPDGKRPLVGDAIRSGLFGGQPDKGSLLDFFAWLAFCLQVTYADFFGALGSVKGEILGQKTESP